MKVLAAKSVVAGLLLASSAQAGHVVERHNMMGPAIQLGGSSGGASSFSSGGGSGGSYSFHSSSSSGGSSSGSSGGSFHTQVIGNDGHNRHGHGNGHFVVHERHPHHQGGHMTFQSSSHEGSVESWSSFISKYGKKIASLASSEQWAELAQFFYSTSAQPDFPIHCDKTTSGHSSIHSILKLSGMDQDELDNVMKLNQKSSTGGDGWW